MLGTMRETVATTTQTGTRELQGLLERASRLPAADENVGRLAGQARELAERLNDAAGRVQSCLLLADHHLAKGDYEKVVDTLEPLLSPPASLDPAARARTLVTLCRTYTRLCEVNHVLRYGLEALSYYQECHDRETQGVLHGCLGEAFLRLYAFHEALEHYQAQFELLKQQGSSLVEAYTAIGWIHGQLGDFPKALGFLQEALRLAQAEGDTTNEGKALGNLGTTYGNMGDNERAFACLRKAIKLFETQGDLRNAMVWYGNMAYVYTILGDSEQARRHYEKALAQVQKTPNRAYEGWLLLNLGKMLLTTDARRAEALLERGFAVLEEVGTLEGVAEAHEALAAHFEDRGEYAKALTHHRSYAKLEIKTLEDINEKRTEALSVKFELERLQQEREIYQLKNVELAQAVKKLEELSSRDSLTGLHNRRYLDAHLSRTLTEAQLGKQPLSVVLADIDNFKQVNDTFSHATGDEVIKRVARLLSEHTWESDVVARYGGEEFLLVLKETSLSKAKEVAEKLRRKVESYPWYELHPELAITLSMGLCSDVSLGDHEKMLSRADDNLYKAKRSGKNRVVA